MKEVVTKTVTTSKKKMRFSKKVFIVCFLTLIVFTAISVGFQAIYGVELSATLIDKFFTVMGIEFGSLALIKVFETFGDRKNSKEENINDIESDV